MPSASLDRATGVMSNIDGDHFVGRVARDLYQRIAPRAAVDRFDHQAARGRVALAHDREHLRGRAPPVVGFAINSERHDVELGQ